MQTGERAESLGLVVNSDVGVAHGHANVGVTGELFGVDEVDAVFEKTRNVGVPAGGVEVGNPLVGLILDAGLFEVAFYHLPGLSPGELGKERLVRWQIRDPLAHHLDQGLMKREGVFSSPLGGPGFDGDGRLRRIQVKALGREAGKLSFPEARHVREDVDAGAHLSRVALNGVRALGGRFYDQGEFLGREGAPGMANIGLSVPAGNAGKRVCGENSPFGMGQPIAKRVDGLEVMVVRPVAETLLLAVLGQELFDCIGAEFAQAAKPTTLDDGSDPGQSEPDVLRGVVLPPQALLKSANMVAKGCAGLLPQHPVQVCRCGQTHLDPLDQRFDLCGLSLGDALVGAALGCAAAAVVVEELDVVRGVLSLPVAA